MPMEIWKHKPRSEETKKRIGDTQRGKPKKPYLHKPHSEERKQKIRLSSIGKNTWMKGRHDSEEVKKKKKEAHKGNKSHLWKGGISKDKKYQNELAKRREHKRRTLKNGADGSFTLVEWEILKKQYGNRCPLCGRKEPKITLTIDHIIPLSKGGSNYIENIQPLCKPCNSKKHTGIFRITPKGELMLF